MPQAAFDFFGWRRGLQPDKHAAMQPVDSAVRDVAEQSPDMLVEPGFKPPPVVPLQGDLVIVNQECLSHRLNLHVRRSRWAGNAFRECAHSAFLRCLAAVTRNCGR